MKITERQAVTVGLFGLTAAMLAMAVFNDALWEIEIFKTLLQAVVITGLLNMVVAFHFAANKNDEQKTDNTAKAFDAITATANAGQPAGGDDEPLPVTVTNDKRDPVPTTSAD